MAYPPVGGLNQFSTHLKGICRLGIALPISIFLVAIDGLVKSIKLSLWKSHLLMIGIGSRRVCSS
jgi:hypothetical protein